MSVREQVQSLTAALTKLPSEAFIRVLLFMIKASLSYWGNEAARHHRVMMEFPAESAMRRAAAKHYDASFAHWHRMSMLSRTVEEVLAAKPYGAASAREAARLAA